MNSSEIVRLGFRTSRLLRDLIFFPAALWIAPATSRKLELAAITLQSNGQLLPLIN